MRPTSKSSREGTVLVLTSQVQFPGERGITRLEPFGYLVAWISLRVSVLRLFEITDETALGPPEHVPNQLGELHKDVLMQLVDVDAVIGDGCHELS